MNILKYSHIILITLSVFLFANNYRLHKKVEKLDSALGITKSNLEQYQSIINGYQDKNRVLQLTLEDFRQSNDSLIKRLNNQAKDQKIKTKEIKEVSSIETVFIDTLTMLLPSKDVDFSVTFEPNTLTTIKVERINGMLTCIPSIFNSQDLYVVEEKVWRNKRKNFFSRLIHFDFKKDKIHTYKIINSNDKIKTLSTRVIKISK